MPDFSWLPTIGGIVFAAGVLWSWVGIGARVWQQRERNAFADKLARDTAPETGPFAVYLRAFRHPGYVGLNVDLNEQLHTLISAKHTGTDGRNGVRPLESVLADIFDKDMPLVGLGRPIMGLKSGGAGLVRTTDAEWKDVVTSLLDRCSVIVMTPSANAGTAWEIAELALRPEWRSKTVYFMPSYQAELIRALQPYVAGYEAIYGTARFVAPKGTPKQGGSITLYALSLFVRAVVDFLLSMARVIIDVAFAFLLLALRFGKSLGLRGRWSAARRVGRARGLEFPRYQSKGAAFLIDDVGKANVLTDLQSIAFGDLKKSILGAAHGVAKRVTAA